MKFRNPLAFTPLPVTLFTTLFYAAIFIPLLIVHLTLPAPPAHVEGINLDEAWHDLQNLTSKFHPYNSYQNDAVRTWLLEKIKSIIDREACADLPDETMAGKQEACSHRSAVAVISDLSSNVSYGVGSNSRRPGYSAYFEGTNIMVYIRGSDDDPSEWWLHEEAYEGLGGVLVNAHYDSVSTGYGATDDGVGVISVLQLIKYFANSNRQPKKGILALLNNGEEDDLYGARAFAQHPASKFPRTFLNLEGAGAGGRSVLFRSTDCEATQAYQNVPYPYGTVTGADAFKRGLIKSDTDYSVFTSLLGMRGLDVAFMEPRARYHTDQDDVRHTSQASLYHMLSAALATMQSLTEDTRNMDKNTQGVWFDLFGTVFAVFRLHTLSALSITVLVLAPISIIAIWLTLGRSDRSYLFSGSKQLPHIAEHEAVSIRGRRGLLRWPVAFTVGFVAVATLALIVARLNPFIISSSPYAVWSMMLSGWFCITWAGSNFADYARPTALQRLYTLIWMSMAGWIALVAATVIQQRDGIGSGYLVFFYVTCIVLATLVSFLELFGLPRKTQFVEERLETQADPEDSSPPHLMVPNDDNGDREDEVDERTSLIRGARSGGTTFKHYRSTNPGAEATDNHGERVRKVYGSEQAWSYSLPSSLWIVQLLLLVPFPTILIGQVALLLTSGLPQTLADGSDATFVYLAFAGLTVLLLTPIGPFLHRFTFHVPLFLFAVLIGTTIYNLVAFPFSPNNRFKVYFQQHLDLDTGINNVSFTGSGQGSYLLRTVQSLPSAAGKEITCQPSTRRSGLTECRFHGLNPKVASTVRNNRTGHTSNHWVQYSITSAHNERYKAMFKIFGSETRACRIDFDRPISSFQVDGSGPADDRMPLVGPASGSQELKLWSRTWNRTWEGTFEWNHQKGMTDGIHGRVTCLWSDANIAGTIPALDEAWQYTPDWVAITKTGDGLVEASKEFHVW